MTEELISIFNKLVDEKYGYIPFEYALPDQVEYVDDEHIDSGRWGEVRRVIVEYNERLYAVEYTLGLTELQENEFYPDASSIYPVRHTTKFVEHNVYTAQ